MQLPVPLWQGGDLRDALGKDYRHGTHVFDWHKKGQDVALAIAQGLHFLHHSNVIHRCSAVHIVSC